MIWKQKFSHVFVKCHRKSLGMTISRQTELQFSRCKIFCLLLCLCVQNRYFEWKFSRFSENGGKFDLIFSFQFFVGNRKTALKIV